MRCPSGLPGHGEVVPEHARYLLEPAGCRRLQGPGGAEVESHTVGPEQALVCGLLDEAVPEAVGRLKSRARFRN